MPQELELPSEVPVMTLDGVVLFPQAMIPLYIFEPRYRLMLTDVLERDRIFAVASVDRKQLSETNQEPPHRIAGVGVVRACRKNDDGTANLILQGLARVECAAIVEEQPFRRIRIRPFPSERDGGDPTLAAMQSSLLGLVRKQMQLEKGIPRELLEFLSQVDEPEATLDLAIHTLCTVPALKQELLETRGILARFEKFERFLRARIGRLELERDLRKGTGDSEPGQN